MCLIVDANAASIFLAQKSAITEWLLGPKGKPRLCSGGKLRAELDIIAGVRLLLRQLSEAGRLRNIPDKEIQTHEKRLKSAKLHRSNDVHVLALAISSGARTLATFDGALSDDFRDPRIINNPRGKIYSSPDKHAHLLCHTPKSCHVHAK